MCCEKGRRLGMGSRAGVQVDPARTAAVPPNVLQLGLSEETGALHVAHERFDRRNRLFGR